MLMLTSRCFPIAVGVLCLRIQGTVTDPSGSVIPNAKVVANAPRQLQWTLRLNW